MRPALWVALLAGCAPAPATIHVQGPDGAVVTPCSSGCARPEQVVHATHEEIAARLVELAATPAAADSSALDWLVFHGDDVAAYLDSHGAGDLPDAHAERLRSELALDRVAVDFRLEAEDGRVLGHLEDVFPFVEHQDFVLADTGELGRISMNGKVKRVGPRHLWARF